MTNPRQPHTVWRRLAEQSGGLPDGEVQAACIEAGLMDAVCEAGTDAEWEAAYARLARHVGRLEAMREAPGEVLPTPADRGTDPRWALLADLSARSGSPLFQPTLFRPWIRGGGNHSLPRSNSVEVRFDDRLTLDAAVAALRSRWPELIRRGVVRSRPRRMNDNTVELLRFVCLETELADSWDARWRAWQVKHGRQGTGWSYPTRRAFISDVHRAEQSLVGSSRGLAWFYEPIAREEWSALVRRAGQGDGPAEREVQRREDMGLGSLGEAFRRADKVAAGRAKGAKE